jgi:hypothetical protein
MPGRQHPITIFTPVRRLWALWLSLSWPLARPNPLVVRPLRQLSFIHFAHWSLVRRVPRRRGRRLPYPYVLFQSNFNGAVDQYVDAFALVVPWRMRLMWGGAYGFPDVTPTGRFKRYVLEHQVPATDHYWSAYPEASTRMIRSALALREPFEAFAAEARDLPPERFAAAWRRFVTEVQSHL